jgi:aminoglycoside 6-adenylyltransferase
MKREEAIQRLVEWAEKQEAIRAILLTSTLTNPNAPVDIFSDYDVILAVEDIHPYFDDDAWLGDFGKVLVYYKDPIQLQDGFETFAYITQYEDGTKIDYTLVQLGWLPWVAAQPELPPFLDIGYITLLDKDGLATGLKPPTYSAYIPNPPSEEEYRLVIQLFFHEATYVAKHLWRDDLIPAKYNLDTMMKFEFLRKMLEWRMEINHGWAVKTGAYGKGLKKRLPSDLWLEFEKTYVGAGLEENWEALFRTIDLFRKVASEVGDHLGYAYPQELDRRSMEYFRKVKKLDRQAHTMDFEE